MVDEWKHIQYTGSQGIRIRRKKVKSKKKQNFFQESNLYVWVPCKKSVWADSTDFNTRIQILIFLCVFNMRCDELRTQNARLRENPTTNSKRYKVFVVVVFFYRCFILSLYSLVCRQKKTWMFCSRPKLFVRYCTLWRQFIRIIAVVRLCFFADAVAFVYIPIKNWLKLFLSFIDFIITELIHQHFRIVWFSQRIIKTIKKIKNFVEFFFPIKYCDIDKQKVNLHHKFIR